MHNSETTINELTRYNAIILAGGNSTRMNFPKVWLPFNKEQSFLEHIVDSYLELGCHKIIVVLNSKFVDGFKNNLEKIRGKSIVVLNSNPEKGRMYSLKLGINSITNNERTFIHNVDQPDIESSTLLGLLKTNPVGFARPIFSNKGGHPILVSNIILEKILKTKDSVLMRDLLIGFTRDDIQVNDSKVILNINTPEEYRSHFGMDVPIVNGNNYAAVA